MSNIISHDSQFCVIGCSGLENSSLGPFLSHFRPS